MELIRRQPIERIGLRTRISDERSAARLDDAEHLNFPTPSWAKDGDHLARRASPEPVEDDFVVGVEQALAVVIVANAGVNWLQPEGIFADPTLHQRHRFLEPGFLRPTHFREPIHCLSDKPWIESPGHLHMRHHHNSPVIE